MDFGGSMGDRKRWLLMLAACLIPLGLLLAVFAFRLDVGGLGILALLLLCPLLHLFMGHGQAGHAGHDSVENQSVGSPSAPTKPPGEARAE